MTRPSLRDRVDIDNVAAIADDEIDLGSAGVLGKLVFYTIGDRIRVTRSELEALFETYEIESRYLPKAIVPASIAATVLKGVRAEAAIDGRAYELRFHVEPKIDGSIEAPLVRTRRRTRAEREAAGGLDAVPEWDVETVAYAVWDPEYPEELPTEVDERRLGEFPYEPILEETVADFVERCRFYGGPAISQVVSRILNETMSIRTRPSGGVWLIPVAAMELLGRLEEMIRVLDAQYVREAPEGKTPAETEFDSIVLVDREKNRLFVRDKVEGRVVEEITLAMERLAGIAQAGVPPKPSDLAEAAEIRKRALAYRDGFAAAVAGSGERVIRALADFDRAYASALRAGS